MTTRREFLRRATAVGVAGAAALTSNPARAQAVTMLTNREIFELIDFSDYPHYATPHAWAVEDIELDLAVAPTDTPVLEMGIKVDGSILKNGLKVAGLKRDIAHFHVGDIVYSWLEMKGKVFVEEPLHNCQGVVIDLVHADEKVGYFYLMPAVVMLNNEEIVQLLSGQRVKAAHLRMWNPDHLRRLKVT